MLYVSCRSHPNRHSNTRSTSPPPSPLIYRPYSLPQAFLEAVYLFMHSLPLADLWQDEAWQRHMALLQQQQQQEAGGTAGGFDPAMYESTGSGLLQAGAPAGLLPASRLLGRSGGTGLQQLQYTGSQGHHGLGPGLPVRQQLSVGPGRVLRGHHTAAPVVYERPRSRGVSREQQPPGFADPIAAARAAAVGRFTAAGGSGSDSLQGSGSVIERPATCPPHLYAGSLGGSTSTAPLSAAAGQDSLGLFVSSGPVPGAAQGPLPVAAGPVVSSRRPGATARRAAAARRAALNSALVLAWLPGKHDQELMKMKGQSSTWYFLEQLHVSALRANVTIALTSSITKASAQGISGPGAVPAPSSSSAAARGGLGSGGAGAGGLQLGRPEEAGSEQGPGGMLTEVQRVLVRGMLNRLSGSSGLQLINVSDVGLQLSALDERNRLVNQVGLASLISNHYTWRAYAELRKVGAGALGVSAVAVQHLAWHQDVTVSGMSSKGRLIQLPGVV